MFLYFMQTYWKILLSGVVMQQFVAACSFGRHSSSNSECPAGRQSLRRFQFAAHFQRVPQFCGWGSMRGHPSKQETEGAQPIWDIHCMIYHLADKALVMCYMSDTLPFEGQAPSLPWESIMTACCAWLSTPASSHGATSKSGNDASPRNFS